MRTARRGSGGLAPGATSLAGSTAGPKKPRANVGESPRQVGGGYRERNGSRTSRTVTTVCALASRPGGGHAGGRCSGPLTGHGDGAFTSDGFGCDTAGPFLPYL